MLKSFHVVPKVIFLICAAVLLLTEFSPEHRKILGLTALNSHEIYPWLTYSFVHGGFLHFIMNSSVLLITGSWIIHHFGLKYFTILFLASFPAGALGAYFIIEGNDQVNVIGLSGVIASFIAVSHFNMFPYNKKAVAIEVIILIGVHIAIAVYGWPIAWQAHATGYFFGLGFTVFMWMMGSRFIPLHLQQNDPAVQES